VSYSSSIATHLAGEPSPPFSLSGNALFGFLNRMLGGVGLLLYHRKKKTLNPFKHVFVSVAVFIVLAIAII
jgi:hypothetical protein